jgi:hypothetical protein
VLTQDNNALNWSWKARKYNTAASGAVMSTQSCMGVTQLSSPLAEFCAQSPRNSFPSSLAICYIAPQNCKSVDAKCIIFASVRRAALIRQTAKPPNEQLSQSGKPSSCPVANDEAVAACFTKLLQNVVDVNFYSAKAKPQCAGNILI